MLVHRAYRYELDLNNAQRTACLRHAGAARWAFNFGLRRKLTAKADGERMPTAIDLHRELNRLKQTTVPWMYEVSKCAPQEALRNLDKAFTNFFEGRARLPKFKSRKRGIGGFRLTGAIHVSGRVVRLPRLGELRLKEDSAVTGKILSATVRERAGRWFVSLQVAATTIAAENQGSEVGVDLGVLTLATLSDGKVFENPKAYRRELRKLKQSQRKLSRCRKGSKRRLRARYRVSKLHQRIANIRADAIHKLTTFIATTYGVVGIEDLNVRGMLKNHKLAGAISDSAFAEIRRQLAYKCQWYGSRLVIHERFLPSSKLCSRCGEINRALVLADRVFRCECGLVLDRDLNAAINLRPGVPRSLDVDGGGAGCRATDSETTPSDASTEHCASR